MQIVGILIASYNAIERIAVAYIVLHFVTKFW